MAHLPLETIARNVICDVSAYDSCVIQTTRDWEKLLLEMFYPERISKIKELDPNFRSTTLIGVYLGVSIPGSAIEITSVEYTKSRGLYIHVERNIMEGSNNILNTYSPYHLVRIPKRTGRYRFNYTDNPDLTMEEQ